MSATVSELVLGAESDAVPRARQWVVDALVAAPAGQREDAELVVAELVTNAVLHGAPPVTLRVLQLAHDVRIEVEDEGRHRPIPVRAGPDAMTGRGLNLVACLSTRWGVDPTSDGKVVWAEVPAAGTEAITTHGGEPEEMDVDSLLASWADIDDADEVFTVSLGAVPTNLLLDAKAHIDNLVRELTLAASGAESPDGPRLSADLAELVQTVVYGFAEARAQIKQQALAAAARGLTETDLRLTLRASAVDAGERYLAALDEADGYARAARLLTLETQPVHRVFREWYVGALVEQLRGAAEGAKPARVMTFLERLATEVTELTPLREVAARLRLLQKVTAELTGAVTMEEVAHRVCSRAFDVLGALSARVYLLTPDRKLRSVATTGGDVDIAAQYDEFPADAELPGADALRAGAPIIIRNVADLTARYPSLAEVYTLVERTLLVAPLVAGDHQLGVLSLTFRGRGDVDEQTQLALLTTLADVTAQALDRAAASAVATQASKRLAFLADASVVLSSSLDYRVVLEAVAGLVVPRLADWCAIQLLEGDQLNTVALTHVDPEKVAWAQEVSARYPNDLSAPTGAPNVIRTGRSELYPFIPPELIEAGAVDEEHLRLIQQFGLSSALVVPLVGRSGVIGALTLIYAESGRLYDDEDVAFAEDLARRAALAVETAHAFHEQSGRLATVTRVAEAAQHAILATLPPRIGSVALAARYVSAAAEALVGGDLYEVVDRPGGVRLLVGDVRGKGLEAVRLATVVLGEFRAAAADIDDLVDVAAQIDRRLRRYLGDEDFVTAVLAELTDDGELTLVNCGHPPALVASAGRVEEIPTPASLPLGLGAAPHAVRGRLQVGDRLLLYTDGIIEARDADQQFVDLRRVVGPLSGGGLDEVLDRVLVSLRRSVGAALGDDLALVVAEYCGPTPS
jgi:serine phosphatase RsbU (regulator of sigma subunit)/anti-sigma regulatory factor (Ser/Thr protein kinase)